MSTEQELSKLSNILSKLPDELNKTNAKLVQNLEKVILSSSRSTSGGATRETQTRLNSMRSWNSSLDDSSSAMDDYKEGLEDLTHAVNSYNNGIRDSHDALKKFSQNIGNSSQSLKSQSAILTGLIEGNTLQNDKLDDFSTNIIKSAKSLSLFHDAITKGFKDQWGNKQIINSINSLDLFQNQLARNADFLEKALGEYSNLADEISRVSAMEKDKLGVNERVLLKIAEESNLRGMTNEQIKEHIGAVKGQIRTISTQIYKYQALAKTTDFINDKFGIFGRLLTGAQGPMAWLIGGFSLLGASVSGLYQQFKMLADSGMIRAGLQVKRAQLDMGLSFEAATKLFQENARNLANVSDFSGFIRSMESAQTGFMKLGVSVEQAAMLASDARKNMVEAGVNIVNDRSFLKAVKVQQDAYAKLKASTGMSAEQFSSLNAELFSSIDVQRTMVALNEVERLQKIRDMNELRQSFINLGLSSDKAQKAMMTITELGKQKVVDRWQQAAKLQAAAAMAGLENAGELAAIYRKNDMLRTNEERMILAKGAEAIMKNAETRIKSGAPQEMVSELQLDYIGPLAQLGRDMSLSADAQGKISDKQLDTLQKDSELKDSTVAAMKAIARLNVIKEDPATKAIAGLAAVGIGILGGIKLGISKLATSASSITEAVENSSGSITGAIQDLARAQEAYATQVTEAANKPPETISPDRPETGKRSRKEEVEKIRAKQQKEKPIKVDCCKEGTTEALTRGKKKGGSSVRANKEVKIPRRRATRSSYLSKVAGTIQNMAEGATQLGTSVSEGTSVVTQAMGNATEPLLESKGMFKKFFSSFKSLFGGSFGKLLKTSLKAWPIIGSLITGVFEGASGFMDATSTFNLKENEVATTQQKVLSGLGGVLKGMLLGMGDGFVNDMMRWLDTDLTKAFDSSGIIDKLGYTGKLVGDFFTNIFSGIKSFAGIFGDDGQFFDFTFLTTIIDGVTWLLEAFNNLVLRAQLGLTKLSNFFGGAFEGIGLGLSKAAKDFSIAFDNMKLSVQESILAVYEKINFGGITDNLIKEKKQDIAATKKSLAITKQQQQVEIDYYAKSFEARDNRIKNIEQEVTKQIENNNKGVEIYKKEKEATKAKEKANKDKEEAIKVANKELDLAKKFGKTQALNSFSVKQEYAEKIARAKQAEGTTGAAGEMIAEYKAETKAANVKPILAGETASTKSAANKQVVMPNSEATTEQEPDTQTPVKSAEELLTEISNNIKELLKNTIDTQTINKNQLELLTALVETNQDATDFIKYRHTGVPGNNFGFFKLDSTNLKNRQLNSF